MNKQIVKVFDAYSVENDDYYKDQGISSWALWNYDNHVVDKNGMVDKKFKPDPKHITEKPKYTLDMVEQQTLSMLKSSEKKAKDLYESCSRKYTRYMQLILMKQFPNEELYFGDAWDCPLSPFNHCIYSGDECIFCGGPEERK